MISQESMADRKNRTYALPADVLGELDALADLGIAKEKVAAAGIRLFSAAPPALRDAALRADTSAIKRWYGDAQDVGAVALIEQMKRDALAAAEASLSRKGKGGGKA